MPRIYKSGKEFEGNENSGRKTRGVELAQAINSGLANEIGNQELKRIKATPSKKRKREDLKEVVMPIVLKGITEKKDISVTIPKPLLDNIRKDVSDNDSASQDTETQETD